MDYPESRRVLVARFGAQERAWLCVPCFQLANKLANLRNDMLEVGEIVDRGPSCQLEPFHKFRRDL